MTAIFIHGIASNANTFNGLLEYLETKESLKNVRLISFDLLGSGESLDSDELNYNYKDQLEALDNSIRELSIHGPIVLVGHSMGTLISTRYAYTNSNVKKLVLISPPVYTKKDLENPAFKKAMEGFQEIVGQKNRKVLESKAFNNEMKYIVANEENYDYLAGVKIPTDLIYGELDHIIASFNIPKLLKKNSKIKAFKTVGRHSITKDKYKKVLESIEEALND